MSFNNFYYNEEVSRALSSTFMKDDGTWEDKDGTEFSTKKFHEKLGVCMKKKVEEPKKENKKVKEPKKENKKVKEPKKENNDVYKTAIEKANYFIYDNLD